MNLNFEPVKNKIREGLGRVNKHKKEIGVAGALLIGNGVAGVVFERQMERINKQEQVISAIVGKTVELKRNNCMTEGHILADEGYLITYEDASEVCDDIAQKEMAYWRSVIAGQIDPK